MGDNHKSIAFSSDDSNHTQNTDNMKKNTTTITPKEGIWLDRLAKTSGASTLTFSCHQWHLVSEICMKFDQTLTMNNTGFVFLSFLFFAQKQKTNPKANAHLSAIFSIRQELETSAVTVLFLMMLSLKLQSLTMETLWLCTAQQTLLPCLVWKILPRHSLKNQVMFKLLLNPEMYHPKSQPKWWKAVGT